MKTKFDFSVFQFNLLPVCGVCVSLFVVSAFEKNSNKNKEKKEDKNIEKKKKKSLKFNSINSPARILTYKVLMTLEIIFRIGKKKISFSQGEIQITF